MDDNGRVINIATRELTIFYLLDTSGSMSSREPSGETKISVLNRTMRETLTALKNIAPSLYGTELRFAVMEFNTNASWITSNGPERCVDFAEWKDLKAFGGTLVCPALSELNSKLDRNVWLATELRPLLPTIIFMTDGGALDYYSSALAEIKRNKWFERATKIGIALGADADRDMISDVVGSSEAVLSPDSLDEFSETFRVVSERSSMMKSIENPEMGVSGASIVSGIDREKPDDDNVWD